jgi:hypothetical protein
VSEDRARFGSRLLAFAALWFLLSGLLMALSFVVAALVAYAALLAVVLAIGGRWLLRQLRAGEVMTEALVSGGHGAERVGRRLQGLGLRRRVGRGFDASARSREERRPGRPAAPSGSWTAASAPTRSVTTG